MILDLLQARDDATRLLAAMRPRPCLVCMAFGITKCIARRPRGPFAALVRAQRIKECFVCPAHEGLSSPCTPENCRYMDHGNSAP